jgi:hypothetical protein
MLIFILIIDSLSYYHMYGLFLFELFLLFALFLSFVDLAINSLF